MPSADAFLDEPPVKRSADQFLDEPAPSKSTLGAPEIQAAEEQQAMERKAAETATLGDARNTMRDMLDTGTEGVARGLLGPASMLLSKEELQKPRVPAEAMKYAMIYPKVADVAAEAFPNGPAQYVKPVTDALANTASGFTSAQNVALLGLAPEGDLAQRLIAGTFLGQSIVGTPEQWEAFKAAPTVPEKIRIATEMGLSLALPGMALAHSRAGEVPKPKPDLGIKEAAPESVGVNGQNKLPKPSLSGESLAREPQEMMREGPPSAEDARGLPVSKPVTQRFVQPEGAPVVPESQTTAGITRNALAWRKELMREGQQLGIQAQVMSNAGMRVPKPLSDRINEINAELARGFQPEQQPKYEMRGEAPLEEELPPETIPRPKQEASAVAEPSEPNPPPQKVQAGEFPQRGYTATDPPQPVERVSDDPFISRIANRFTQERAERGELGDVEPGQGHGTEDIISRGLKMSPEEINQHVSDIMRNEGNDPVAQGAAIRAEEARLSDRSTELSRVAEANPADLTARQAANAAFQDLTDFHNGPVAKVKERFHVAGMTLQREIPVDLSTFNGLREAWLKDTGKAPPVHMEPTFRKVAGNVRRAMIEERTAVSRLGLEIEKATRGRKLPSAEEVRNSIVERMKDRPCRI